MGTVSICGAENVPSGDGGGGDLHNSINVLNAIELHTEEWLQGVGCTCTRMYVICVLLPKKKKNSSMPFLPR